MPLANGVGRSWATKKFGGVKGSDEVILDGRFWDFWATKMLRIFLLAKQMFWCH